MNLNLVADYDVRGKHLAAAFVIHSSSNLIELPKMTAMSYPVTGGGFVSVAPKFLLMCESKRKAEAVAETWNRDYKKQGRFYDFAPIDRLDIEQEA